MTSLPAAALARVVQFAADVLPAVPAAELPGSLRQFASFAPARRAKLAGAALAAAVANEAGFRTRVAEAATAALTELAAANDTGVVPADAVQADVAALAYLRRPEGWRRYVAAAVERLEAASAEAGAVAEAGSALRLAAELSPAKAAGRAASEKLRADLDAAKREVASLRGQLEQVRAGAGPPQRDRGGEAARVAVRLRNRRLRRRPSGRRRPRSGTGPGAASSRPRSRRSSGRPAQPARTTTYACACCSTRWSGPPAGCVASSTCRRRPARPRPLPDTLAGEAAAGSATSRGRGADDPAWLDALLVVPGSHLVVDGYNVTKTGYGDLPLKAQRTRLVGGLAGLAARTGAEVTCVFDGSDVSAAVTQPTARGVRVRFSRPGHTADEVIAAFVRASPPADRWSSSPPTRK